MTTTWRILPAAGYARAAVEPAALVVAAAERAGPRAPANESGDVTWDAAVTATPATAIRAIPRRNCTPARPTAGAPRGRVPLVWFGDLTHHAKWQGKRHAMRLIGGAAGRAPVAFGGRAE